MVKKLKGYKKAIEFHIRKYAEKRYRTKFRKKLTNDNFTIISNNCWGGGIYEALDLEYKTPTVGLFLYAPCYIKLIRNLKNNLLSELKFIDHSKYEIANEARKTNPYPIGLVNDEIEIHFLHYKTHNDALEKWKRRCERVNFNNLYFSLTDNDLCSFIEIEAFDKFPGKKVFFSANKIDSINSLVWLKEFSKRGKVGDLYSNPWLYRKYFNVVKWLNN